MKKIALIVILLAILVASCLMLTACSHACEFGEGAVIIHATCTENGLMVRVCECGESKLEIIPASHSYTSVVTSPTCTEQGFTTHTCDGCCDSYVDAYVETYSKDGVHDFKRSNACAYCGQNIDDVAVDSFGTSATADDNVAYLVPRQDGNYDVYIKGTGAMEGYYLNNNRPFKSYGSKIAIIYIDEGVTSIGEYAFCEYSGLTSVIIPNSVTRIGEAAFAGCSSLRNITIPASVTNIGTGAFGRCSSLTSVIFEDSNGYWVADVGWSNFVIYVTDPTENATYLTDTYSAYYWCKYS